MSSSLTTTTTLPQPNNVEDDEAAAETLVQSLLTDVPRLSQSEVIARLWGDPSSPPDGRMYGILRTWGRIRISKLVADMIRLKKINMDQPTTTSKPIWKPPPPPVQVQPKSLCDLLARPTPASYLDVTKPQPISSSSSATNDVTTAPPQQPVTEPTTMLWNSQQQRVLDFVNDGANVFFTGAAGSGKSKLLRHIVQLETTRRPNNGVHVIAPTGIAASNIDGQTLNSFAGIGLGQEPVEELLRRIVENQAAFRRWRTCSLLVIDEISMVDPALFEKLEEIARRVRNTTQVFGGIQVIITGDFFQLPPIESSKNENRRFCFQSHVWNHVVTETVILHQVYRQSDSTFAQHLNNLRLGNVTQEFERLMKQQSSTKRSSNRNGIEPTRLFARNAEVDRVNGERLRALDSSTMHRYKAKDYVRDQRWTSVLNAGQAPQELALAIGAQVVVVKNLPNDKLVNGSRGVVVNFVSVRTATAQQWSSNEFHQHYDVNEMVPLVRFLNGQEIPIGRCEFEIREGGVVVATRSAIPLKLAWALSIHKSQGMQIDHLMVDLSGVFEFGQAYVALSRASSLEGLCVSGFRPGAVFCHAKVKEWYAALERTQKEQEGNGGVGRKPILGATTAIEEQLVIEGQMKGSTQIWRSTAGKGKKARFV